MSGKASLNSNLKGNMELVHVCTGWVANQFYLQTVEWIRQKTSVDPNHIPFLIEHDHSLFCNLHLLSLLGLKNEIRCFPDVEEEARRRTCTTGTFFFAGTSVV